MVQLVEDDFPDFRLRFGDSVEEFEATLANDPKRRLGDEYKEGRCRPRSDNLEDFIDGSKKAGAWIKEAAERKAAKDYEKRVNLVIYLNLATYGVRQREVVASFRPVAAAAKNAFETVWILSEQRVDKVCP